jgi:hypothetical protein
MSANDERREAAPALSVEFLFCESEELFVAVLLLRENNEFLFVEDARS